jgi:hypothetical protein
MPTLQEDLRLLHDPAVESGGRLAPWVWMAAGIAAAAWVWWWRRRRSPVLPPFAPSAHPVPLSDLLVELELAFLRVRRPEDYPAGLTAMSLILRRAHGREVGRDLTVLTTNELLAAQGHDPAMAGLAAQFLVPADGVRFAGAPLDAGGFRELYDQARAYLLGLPARATGAMDP